MAKSRFLHPDDERAWRRLPTDRLKLEARKAHNAAAALRGKLERLEDFASFMRDEVYERLQREEYQRKREEKANKERKTLGELAEQAHIRETWAE